MKSLPRVMVIATANSSFVRTDIGLLRNFSRVTVSIGSGCFFLMKVLFRIPFHSTILCWFGTVYAAVAVLWAKLFRKKTIIILGGMDAVKIPELGYGIWTTPWKARLLRLAYPRADALLAVSPTFRESLSQLVRYDASNVYVAPTACDTTFWYPEGNKEPIVLTVAHSGFRVNPEEALRRFRIKGLDWLFRCAAQMPDIHFILVGYHQTLLDQMGIPTPPNIKSLDFLSPEFLRNYYRRARVYCQPSLSEGLPNALCEAMACACVPVGSDAGGIPDAIGDSGFIAPYGKDELLIDALWKAIQSESLGMIARERIIQRFSPERRLHDLARFILSE